MKLFLVECPIESCYVLADFQLELLSKKSSWRAVVVMRWPEVIYQEVNKGRLTIILIKYRGREKKRSFTIDFKAFVFSLFMFITSF